MSVVQSFSASSLYCDEATNDVVDSYAHTFTQNSTAIPILLTDDDENSIISIFDSELDQMPAASALIQRYRNLHGVVSARQEAINWMFKVHAYYNFRPETAYLSVNYLDRFILSHTLPQGKGWPLQLLSVACLALAAKMEETIVPLLLDLQVMKPRFMFKPKTVQRMELLVMARLKWRLRIVTPFNFINYFIAKLSITQIDHSSLFLSLASDLILSTCRVIDFLEYPPSIMAAAAVLWVTRKNVSHQKLQCFHKRLSDLEMVKKCLGLIDEKVGELWCVKEEQLVPQSPVGVLDAVTGESCSLKDSKSGQSYSLSSTNCCKLEKLPDL